MLWLQPLLYSLVAFQLLICLNGLPSRRTPLRVAIDVLNLRVAVCCLSARRGHTRASTGKSGGFFFLWLSYIFLCSETPEILFFNLAFGMGYQSCVLTTHDLDLIIWKQKKHKSATDTEVRALAPTCQTSTTSNADPIVSKWQSAEPEEEGLNHFYVTVWTGTRLPQLLTVGELEEEQSGVFCAHSYSCNFFLHLKLCVSMKWKKKSSFALVSQTQRDFTIC